VALSATFLAAGASAPTAPPAFADGDPASDVLAAQPLFLPQDAGLPSSQQAQLAGLLTEAQHSGYRVRAALIASAADLGSVTALWRQPQRYAQFLGQELSLVYPGPLLVVMPDGFGLFGVDKAVTKRAGLTAARLPGHGAELGAAALAAVMRLAAAAGHPLAPTSVVAHRASKSNDQEAWIAFVAGCALVLLAWAASLKARPPKLRNRRVPSA
jgi:hypothetical protein